MTDLNLDSMNDSIKALSIQYSHLVETLKLAAQSVSNLWVVNAHPSAAIYFTDDETMRGILRAYAQWYNVRHPIRKVAWRRLNYPQMCEASELWTKGLL